MTRAIATVVLIFQDVIVSDSDGGEKPALEVSYQQFPRAEHADPEVVRHMEKGSPAVKAARRVIDILSAHGQRVEKPAPASAVAGRKIINDHQNNV